jgi:hypothetical protein
MGAETFTRLTLASPEVGAEEKVVLAVDWRAHDPVQLAVGLVFHSDWNSLQKPTRLDRLLFADALGALMQITDVAFGEYRTDPGMIADMRHG